MNDVTVTLVPATTAGALPTASVAATSMTDYLSTLVSTQSAIIGIGGLFQKALVGLAGAMIENKRLNGSYMDFKTG